MKETITKFTPVEYPEVDFDPSKYTLGELDAIEHKILKEQTDRRKMQEDIDLIELKIKYEHKWVRYDTELYKNTLFFIKNINTVYSIEVVKFSYNVEHAGLVNRYQHFIVETTHLLGLDYLDNAITIDRSDAFNWIFENFQMGLNKFIDSLEGV